MLNLTVFLDSEDQLTFEELTAIGVELRSIHPELSFSVEEV